MRKTAKIIFLITTLLIAFPVSADNEGLHLANGILNLMNKGLRILTPERPATKNDNKNKNENKKSTSEKKTDKKSKSSSEEKK